jgi:hypothetical protein
MAIAVNWIPSIKKLKIYLIIKKKIMYLKNFTLFFLVLPLTMAAQVEKISKNTFLVNADVFQRDSGALSFAKGDTLYLNSDVRVFNLKQYEAAVYFRSCCNKVNIIGENLIAHYYTTLERSNEQYKQQVDLNKRTADLFTHFIDSTRATTKEASGLLTETRNDLKAAKVDLTAALKEIKVAKWLLPLVGTVATILGLVIGLSVKK